MEKSISTLIRVDRHTTIFLTGSRATHWAVVTTGVVAECQISIDGDRRLTGFRLPGEAFGVEIERYSVTSEALTDCVISMFPTNVPAANSRLFAAMARQLNRVRNDHLLTTFRSVPERIAAFLVDLADRGMGECFRLPMARCDIADFLGTTEPTISRALAELERRGAIKRRPRGRIEIINRASLAQVTQGDASPLPLHREQEVSHA
ncbi:Crp/Fnr family transcriptional regulator [Novosphingobium sp.]|uniref:Crp/Fnr family transcriptional regulator n=1 Tax=Novosphingobium sp. TaxID=1874826 RepID=UPI0031E0B7FA